MADYRLIDLGLFVSKRKETSFLTGYTAGADFYKAVTQNAAFTEPQFEKITNAGRAGLSSEFPTEVCVGYSLPIGVSITDDINTSYAGNLLLRAFGGAVTTAQQGVTTAYKHSAPILLSSSSLQLPSSTIINALGGASFRYDGMVVDSYTLSQQGTARPQFAATLINSGKFVRPHGVTSLPSSPTLLSCLDGHNSVVQWTSAAGANIFSAQTCRLRNWSVSINNNLQQNDRCTSDSSMTVTDPSATVTSTPYYAGRLLFGTRTITGSFTVTLDTSIIEWLTYGANDTITDLTFRAQGAVIASTYRHWQEIVLEKATITSTAPGEENGVATETINFEAIFDTSASTPATASVQNTTTSNYD